MFGQQPRHRRVMSADGIRLHLDRIHRANSTPCIAFWPTPLPLSECWPRANLRPKIVAANNWDLLGDTLILAMVFPVERVRNAIQTSTRDHDPTLRPASEVAIAPPRRTPPLQAVWIPGAADCAGGCGNNNCQTEADQRNQDYAAHSNLPPTRPASYLFPVQFLGLLSSF